MWTSSRAPTAMSSSPSDQLMADPYASSAPAKAASPPPGSSSGLFGSSNQGGLMRMPQPAQPAQPDFLFDDNYDSSFRRSWGERLTYHVGWAYLLGFTGGGAIGVAQGLRESAGERQRIRINSVLNATGRRGPGLGNSLGCLAMMCSLFESIAYNVRGTDDFLNPAGAAALTGTLYKITSVRGAFRCLRRPHTSPAACPKERRTRAAPVPPPSPAHRLLFLPRCAAAFRSQGPKIAAPFALGLGAVAAAGSLAAKELAARGVHFL